MFLKNNFMIPALGVFQSYGWHLALFYAKIKLLYIMKVLLKETKGKV